MALHHDLARIMAAIVEGYCLPQRGHHGVAHWARVMENGLRIAQNAGADAEVVTLFALFHDSRRVKEKIDDGDGQRGGDFAQTLRGSLSIEVGRASCVTVLVGVGWRDKVTAVRKQPPKRLETLENLLQQAEHYSEYMMTGRSASVPPTLMALTAEGFIMHIPSRFRADDDKELFSKTIRLMAVGYKATAVAMISESWIVTKKRRDQDLDLSVPPSQSPDREEVVSIMAEAREVRAQRFLFIQRDSLGKFTGFGTSLLPQIQDVEGRFAGLLPPKEPTDEMAMAARNLLQAMGVAIEQVGPDPRWN